MHSPCTRYFTILKLRNFIRGPYPRGFQSYCMCISFVFLHPHKSLFRKPFFVIDSSCQLLNFPPFYQSYLLNEVTGWFCKADQSLETAIKRGVNGVGDQQRVEHFEACLVELEGVRQRVKSWEDGGGVCKNAGDLFRKAGALSALELACSALWRDRRV